MNKEKHELIDLIYSIVKFIILLLFSLSIYFIGHIFNFESVIITLLCWLILEVKENE